MVIKTFGEENNVAKIIDVVALKIIGSGKPITMEAFVVPNICSDLQNPNTMLVSKNYKHLRGLYLADYVHESTLSKDLLIGMDYYFNFMNGNLRKREADEPIAVETCLGWIM